MPKTAYSPNTGELIVTDKPGDWMGLTDLAPPVFNSATQGCFFRDGAWEIVDAQTTPTTAQIIAQYEGALDAHIDSVAQAHRFKDRHSLALRAGYPSAYRSLGLAFAEWMDGCNVQAYLLLQSVVDGKSTMPTINQFIANLPEFVTP